MPVRLSLLLADAGVPAGISFHTVLPYVLVGALVLVVLHLLVFRTGSGKAGRWNWWERLLYLATIVSVAVLAVTSFGALLRYGAVDGWPLFAHMFGAGAFVTILPLLALTWCEANRFGEPSRAAGDRDTQPRFYWFSKAMYWTLLVAGLVVTMTMLLSMLPLLGTDGLHTMLAVHRWSGLVIVVALIFHLYSVLRRRVGTR
jgi:hypothetical protein